MEKVNGMHKMDNIIKESLFKAKSKDLVFITLISLKSIKESLKMINLMAKEYFMIKIKCIKAYGLMVKMLSYSKLKIYKINKIIIDDFFIFNNLIYIKYFMNIIIKILNVTLLKQRYKISYNGHKIIALFLLIFIFYIFFFSHMKHS